jgi:hypothetical protein
MVIVAQTIDLGAMPRGPRPIKIARPSNDVVIVGLLCEADTAARPLSRAPHAAPTANVLRVRREDVEAFQVEAPERNRMRSPFEPQ